MIASHWHRRHRRQSVYNIVGSTEMVRREAPKIRSLKCEVLGEGCSPLHYLGSLGSVAVSSSGSEAKLRRPGDLERFIGLQSRS